MSHTQFFVCLITRLQYTYNDIIWRKNIVITHRLLSVGGPSHSVCSQEGAKLCYTQREYTQIMVLSFNWIVVPARPVNQPVQSVQ